MGDHEDKSVDGDEDSSSAMQVDAHPQEEEATIKIRMVSGSVFSVQLKLSSTVQDLKKIISRHESGIPIPQQRLIYNGCFLKDDKTLVECGLEDDHTIHLIRSASASRSAVAAATSVSGVGILGSSIPRVSGSIARGFSGIYSTGSSTGRRNIRPRLMERTNIQQPRPSSDHQTLNNPSRSSAMRMIDLNNPPMMDFDNIRASGLIDPRARSRSINIHDHYYPAGGSGGGGRRLMQGSSDQTTGLTYVLAPFGPHPQRPLLINPAHYPLYMYMSRSYRHVFNFAPNMARGQGVAVRNGNANTNIISPNPVPSLGLRGLNHDSSNPICTCILCQVLRN